MEFENRVLLGDCLVRLKEIPDCTFDSCVTDVPYGLGDEPTIEEIVAYLQGADLVTGDFMGKDWDIPSIPVWREVYRTLKPGAHVLCFGGTRTFDLISMGLRAAGFENRDTIADDFGIPAFQWMQGQGMPKSHNIEKAAAKKIGKEAAKTFEGWGTALKPAWEPILVFRKPIEGTIANNANKYGTGGMNIDATRVKHASREDFEKHKAQVEAVKAKGGVRGDSWKNSSDLSGANDVQEGGRWPANLLLTHSDGCRHSGTTKVKAHPAWNDNRGPSAFTGAETSPVHHTESDGTETIDTWECVKGCPVAALGSTSRFFQQFAQEPETPFFYTAKASKNEATVGGRIVNEHPTKKPIPLMRWLVRLVTQKGGITLDPYCGSGSTLHAAIEEGVRFTGIERDPASHKTSTERVELVAKMFQETNYQRDLFDLAMSHD